MTYKNSPQLAGWLRDSGLTVLADFEEFILDATEYQAHLRELQKGARPISEQADAAAFRCLTTGVKPAPPKTPKPEQILMQQDQILKAYELQVATEEAFHAEQAERVAAIRLELQHIHAAELKHESRIGVVVDLLAKRRAESEIRHENLKAELSKIAMRQEAEIICNAKYAGKLRQLVIGVIVLLVVLLAFAVSGNAQSPPQLAPNNAYGQTVTITSAGTASTSVSVISSGITSYKFACYPVDPITTAGITLQVSEDNSTWTTAITSTDCSIPNQASATTASANYVRINATTFSGTGSVLVTWRGYIDRSSAGGGGFSGITGGPCTPNDIAYFDTATSLGCESTFNYDPSTNGFKQLGHSAMGADATVDQGSPYILNVYERMGATYGIGNVGFSAYTEQIAGFTGADNAYGFYGGAVTDLTGAAINANELFGMYTETWNAGSGTVGQLTGLNADVQNNGGGTVGVAHGIQVFYGTDGPTTTSYGLYVDSTVVNPGGSLTNNFAVYGVNQDAATNNYFLWYNGTGTNAGVWRVNGLGIAAYYNPTFAVYTPGATNYERIVTQWNTNVAEIGTEASGTGTLRSVSFLGSTVRTKTGMFGVMTTPTYGFHLAPTSGLTAAQTVFIQDATTTTGKTKVILKGGAGDTAFVDRILEIQDSTGAVGAFLRAEGSIIGNRVGTADDTMALVTSDGFRLSSARPIRWGSSTWYGTLDLGIIRSAAGVLEINNGTTGTFRDLTLRGITAVTYAASSGSVVLKLNTPSCSGAGCVLVTGALDSTGKVTTTTTGAASIAITFSTAFSRAPACVAVNETTANLLRATSTTTTVTLAGVTVSGDSLAWTCLGG